MGLSSADLGGVQMTRLGFEPSDIAVVKQLVDVSYVPLSLCLSQLPVISPPKSFDLVICRYTPKDPPYVSHAAGLELHTDYIEKFWGSSISMYDILVSSY